MEVEFMSFASGMLFWALCDLCSSTSNFLTEYARSKREERKQKENMKK